MLIIQDVWDGSLTKFFRSVRCLTSKKQFDFGVDPCHDPDPEDQGESGQVKMSGKGDFLMVRKSDFHFVQEMLL